MYICIYIYLNTYVDANIILAKPVNLLVCNEALTTINHTYICTYIYVYIYKYEYIYI
jgi:hypothetical protein